MCRRQRWRHQQLPRKIMIYFRASMTYCSKAAVGNQQIMHHSSKPRSNSRPLVMANSNSRPP